MHPFRAAESIHETEVMASDALALLAALDDYRTRVAAHFDPGDATEEGIGAAFTSDGFIATPAEVAAAWSALFDVRNAIAAAAPVLGRICKP
jgi:hypothetical protein